LRRNIHVESHFNVGIKFVVLNFIPGQNKRFQPCVISPIRVMNLRRILLRLFELGALRIQPSAPKYVAHNKKVRLIIIT